MSKKPKLPKTPKVPVETSREITNSREVQRRYNHEKAEVIVRSSFIGDESLEDLFFDIITRKLTNGGASMVYCKNSQPAASVPQIGGN